MTILTGDDVMAFMIGVAEIDSLAVSIKLYLVVILCDLSISSTIAVGE